MYGKYLNYFLTEEEKELFRKNIKNEHDLVAFVSENANCFLFNELKNLLHEIMHLRLQNAIFLSQ